MRSSTLAALLLATLLQGKTCIKDFEEDQAAYLGKLDAALVEAQSASYPLETCVVSGERLVGDKPSSDEEQKSENDHSDHKHE